MAMQNATDDELKKQLSLSFEEKHKTEAALKVSCSATYISLYIVVGSCSEVSYAHISL